MYVLQLVGAPGPLTLFPYPFKGCSLHWGALILRAPAP